MFAFWLCWPMCITWRARTNRALALVDDLLIAVEETDEREWEAELHRLKGVLRSSQGKDDLAEGCYLRAIEIARQQQAKFLELRATLNLCHLWQAQGKIKEARLQLATLCSWFTEGCDAPDLRAARSLLGEVPLVTEDRQTS